MRLFSIALWAALWAMCGVAWAAPIPIETARLDNGLEIIILPNPRAPIVTQMLWYRVGGVHEPMGRAGLSHMLEHMMFKGTADVPAGQFSEKIARAGGNENAFTSYDLTAYFQTIAKENLPLTLALEADRMQNLQLTDAAFQPERQVVLEERKSRIDSNPDAIWFEELQAALYRNHPYGRPIIGYAEDIGHYDIDALRAWYQNFYAPNNAVLILAGDVTLDTVMPLIEKNFGDIPQKTLPAVLIATEPAQRARRQVDYTDARIAQRQYLRLWAVPGRNQDAAQSNRLELLTQILGGGRDGILYKELVEKQKLALAASMFYDADKIGPAYAGLSLTPAPHIGGKKLLAAVEKILRGAVKKPLAQTVIERSKNQMIAQEIYARDNNFHLAYALGQTVMTSDSVAAGIQNFTAWDEKIKSITAQELQMTAQALLADTNYVDGWLLPPPGAKPDAATTPATAVTGGAIR